MAQPFLSLKMAKMVDYILSVLLSNIPKEEFNIGVDVESNYPRGVLHS